MMHMKEIARICRGVLRLPVDGGLSPTSPILVHGVSTDTRTIRAGDIFFALRGPNFDGHDYVEEAFRKGAVAAVVRKPIRASGTILQVDNVLTALGNLASVYRMMLGCQVVAITGSNGKTTTKDMISCLLGEEFKTVRAKQSWNNFIGVPLTLFNAGPNTDFLVVEVGTNRQGEIGRLGWIVRPDVAVITSVSESHLEGLGSLDGVAREKAALLDTLRGGGVGVIPAGQPELQRWVKLPKDKLVGFGCGREADVRADDVECTQEGISFRVQNRKFQLALLGDWNVSNALAAIAVATRYGISVEDCAERLREFRPPKMRMERLQYGGFTILNDAYNSNPSSARGAIREFSRFPADGRKVVILGEMKELGAWSRGLHDELGRYLTGVEGIDLVVGVGPDTRHVLKHVEGIHFGEVDEACAGVHYYLHPGDTVLLKGSRANGLENIIKAITGAFPASEKATA